MAVDAKQVHLAKSLAHTSPLINCRFDPSGQYLFATAEDRAIIRWKLDDGSKVIFKGHDLIAGVQDSSGTQLKILSLDSN